MNDDAVYSLLEGVIRQAVNDSKYPDFQCEHPPFVHTYKDCARAYLERLRSHPINHEDTSEIGHAVIGEPVNGSI